MLLTPYRVAITNPDGRTDERTHPDFAAAKAQIIRRLQAVAASPAEIAKVAAWREARPEYFGEHPLWGLAGPLDCYQIEGISIVRIV